jgi:hypothetical protein
VENKPHRWLIPLGVAVVFAAMFLGRDVADSLPILGKLLVSVTAGALLGFQRPGSASGPRVGQSRFVGFVGLVGCLATTVGADVSAGDAAGRLVVVGAGLLACAAPAVLGREVGREMTSDEVIGSFVPVVSYLSGVAFALGDNAVGAGTTLVCVLGLSCARERRAGRARAGRDDAETLAALVDGTEDPDPDPDVVGICVAAVREARPILTEALERACEWLHTALSERRKRRSAVNAVDAAGKVRVPVEATVIPLAGVLLLPVTGTLLGVKSSLFPTGLGLAYSASIAAIGAGFAFWQNLHRMPSGWHRVVRVLKPATVAYLLALALSLATFVGLAPDEVAIGAVILTNFGYLQNLGDAFSLSSVLMDLGGEENGWRRVRTWFWLVVAVAVVGVAVTAVLAYWLAVEVSSGHLTAPASDGAVQVSALVIALFVGGSLGSIESVALIDFHVRRSKRLVVHKWRCGATDVGVVRTGCIVLGVLGVAASLAYTAGLMALGTDDHWVHVSYIVAAALSSGGPILQIAVNAATDGKGKIHLSAAGFLAMVAAMFATIVLALALSPASNDFPYALAFVFAYAPPAVGIWLFEFLKFRKMRTEHATRLPGATTAAVNLTLALSGPWRDHRPRRPPTGREGDHVPGDRHRVPPDVRLPAGLAPADEGADRRRMLLGMARRDRRRARRRRAAGRRDRDLGTDPPRASRRQPSHPERHVRGRRRVPPRRDAGKPLPVHPQDGRGRPAWERTVDRPQPTKRPLHPRGPALNRPQRHLPGHALLGGHHGRTDLLHPPRFLGSLRRWDRHVHPTRVQGELAPFVRHRREKRSLRTGAKQSRRAQRTD